MKRYCLFLFVFFWSASLHAQQDPQYSQYMFNSLAINPAYAGYKETLNACVLHRDQWSGIEGTPKTQSAILDGAFFNEKKVGLGLLFVNDKAGLQNQASAYANFAYRLPVGSDDARLAFGLALGVAQYVFNGNEALIDDPSDPNFNGKQTYFTPDARFGVFYSNDKFYTGFSTTNLLAKTINYSQVGKNTIARQERHYFLTAGYLVEVNDFLKVKPSVLIKDDLKGPTNIDINSFVLLKETVWIGASYRMGANLWGKTSTNGLQSNSLVGALEVFLPKNIRIGYAYDYGLSHLNNYSNGSHELSLGFVLGKSKGTATLLNPRYF